MRVRKRATVLSLVAIMTVTGVAAGGCTIVETPAPTWSSPRVDIAAEWRVALDIKNTRAFWGQHEITLHGTLTDKARTWSNWMSLGGCGGGNLICHSVLSNGINGVVHSWSLLGENVGVGGNLQSLWDAFMNSPGHRANVLDHRWNYVGVGVIRDGSRYFVTMEFMRA